MCKWISNFVLMSVLSLTVIVGTTFSASSAFAALSRQPYLQSVSDTRVVLRWRTTSGTSSRVRYGTVLGSLNTNVDIAGNRTDHEIVISGLTPNTRYFYSVGATSGVIEAGNDADHYFTTAPTVGSNQRLRIWAIGDPGTGDSNQANVRNAYYNLDNVDTDLVLTLGDNAYGDGTDSEYTNNFFNVYEDLLRQAPVWAARGNHERNLGVYEAAFTLPAQAEGGGVPSGTELYYSFDYGNVHFVCLDSFTSGNLNGNSMYTWLENDLASTTQKWIVAFWHHPPYSRSSNHDSDSEVGQRVTRERANPILERYGVDLQLGGHNHFYSRTFLINNHYGLSNTYNTATHAVDSGDGRPAGDGEYAKGAAAEGAVYILAGSSGRLSYTPRNHPAIFSVLQQLGSVVIDVEDDRMDVRFLRSNGTITDNFTITKTPAINQAPVVDAGADQTITLPGTATLTGTVTDDGLPGGGALTSMWSQVSGPGSVSFANSAAASTTASFGSAGTYVLRLSASDTVLSASDDLTVVVNAAPPNTAPVVDAGADVDALINVPLNLAGSVVDDGLPGGSSLTSNWTMVSGPGTVSFTDASAPTTAASFSVLGNYVLRLSASDTDLTSNDTVTITVVPQPPVNQAPVVSAGADQSVERPGSAMLQGSIADDGLPAGMITALWSQISGPGVVTFTDPSITSTTASFSQSGFYVLRLSADDGALQSVDELTVTVTDAPGTVVIIEENNSSGDSQEVKDGQRGAQSFSHPAADFSVTKVNLYLSRKAGNATPSGPLLFSIGTAVNNGLIVGSEVSIDPSDVSDTSGGASFAAVEVVLANPLNLGAGATYYMNFDNRSTNGEAYLLSSTGGNSYPRGSYYKGGSDDGKDIRFQIFGTVSATAPDTQAPSAVVNLRASSVTSNNVSLQWDASTDNVGVATYRLSRDGAVILNSNVLTFDDVNLAPGTSFAYAVVAVDQAGNESTPTNISVTTAMASDTQAPSQVVNLIAMSVTDTGATLTWDAATDNIAVTEYRVSRNGTAVGNTTALMFVENNLMPGSSYSYSVVALDAAGNTSPEATMTIMTNVVTGGGGGGNSGGGSMSLASFCILASLLFVRRRNRARPNTIT